MRLSRCMLAAGCGLAIALSACGGDDDESSAPPAADTLATTKIERALEEALPTSDVSCPPEIVAEYLARETCEITAKGEEGTVEFALVKASGDRIHYWLEIGSQKLEGEIGVPLDNPRGGAVAGEAGAPLVPVVP